jgi:uncharacterized CHY-type Zn-finger protein
MMQRIHGEEVYGVDVDEQTRCAHYRSDLDIIAIKFNCCNKWFPCIECHAARSDHQATVWPARNFNELAVLCGACGHQLSVREYLECGSKCLSCNAQFNPGCERHYHLYFEW